MMVAPPLTRLRPKVCPSRCGSAMAGVFCAFIRWGLSGFLQALEQGAATSRFTIVGSSASMMSFPTGSGFISIPLGSTSRLSLSAHIKTFLEAEPVFQAWFGLGFCEADVLF
jgi:hypothetical protein